MIKLARIFSIVWIINLKEKLTTFILMTQDDETGGFSDRPGDMVIKARERHAIVSIFNRLILSTRYLDWPVSRC